jgi:N-carbamoylputrescine amidase
MRDIRIAVAICAAPVGRTQSNLAAMVPLVHAARSGGAAIVCFPELNLTGYCTRKAILQAAEPIPGPSTDRLATLAAKARITILAGLAEKAPRGRVFASHVVITPTGIIGHYRKLHIAPPEQRHFTAGDALPLFHVAGLTFGIQLCYDAHFPELTTRMALEGAEAVFMPHASPRGTPEEKRLSWMRHLPARAFDNGIFIIAGNQCGDNHLGLSFPHLALALGPSGEAIAGANSEDESLMFAELARRDLERVRRHRMRFFLPRRRSDLWHLPASRR